MVKIHIEEIWISHNHCIFIIKFAKWILNRITTMTYKPLDCFQITIIFVFCPIILRIHSGNLWKSFFEIWNNWICNVFFIFYYMFIFKIIQYGQSMIKNWKLQWINNKINQISTLVFPEWNCIRENCIRWNHVLWGIKDRKKR